MLATLQTLQIARLSFALVQGPAAPAVETEWYAEQACKAFPDDLCSDWHVVSVEACDDDGETACVVLTHPTAWGNTPHTFMGVYSADALAYMAVKVDGVFTRIFE